MRVVFLKEDGTPSAAAETVDVVLRRALDYTDASARRIRIHMGGLHGAALEVLDAAGARYATGYDARRGHGGPRGDFIELTRREARRFVELVKALKAAKRANDRVRDVIERRGKWADRSRDR